MECPWCGAYNTEGAAFCDLCLRSFTEESSKAAPDAEAPKDSAPPRIDVGQPLPPGADKPASAGNPKRKWIYVSAGIVLVLVVAGVLGYVFLTGGHRNSNPKKLSVLFLGNSYTSVNDLPTTVSRIAQSLGNTLDFDSATPGGYTLQQHAGDQNTISKIASKMWNAVVFQEQSQVPAVYTETQKAQLIVPYAQMLNSMIHQANPAATTVLYETWGRQNGDSQFASKVPEVGTYAGDQARINATYEQLAASLPATLAPVGKAWALVRQTHPDIQLYQGDGSHPSAAGTYLAACVIYDTLFNDRVNGATALNLDPAQAKILQEAADQTVSPPASQSR